MKLLLLIAAAVMAAIFSFFIGRAGRGRGFNNYLFYLQKMKGRYSSESREFSGDDRMEPRD